MTATKLIWTKVAAGKYEGRVLGEPREGATTIYTAEKTGGVWTLRYNGDYFSEHATYSMCRDIAATHESDVPLGDSRNVPSSADLRAMTAEIAAESKPTGGQHTSPPAEVPLTSRGGQHSAPTMTEAEEDRYDPTRPAHRVAAFCKKNGIQTSPELDAAVAAEKRYPRNPSDVINMDEVSVATAPTFDTPRLKHSMFPGFANSATREKAAGMTAVERAMAEADPEMGARIAARVAAENPPHIVVSALAGCGKTTTLVGGVQVMLGFQPKAANGTPLVPSPQQKAVWDALALSRGARTVGFLAFNKSIATELQARVPPGCEAMTNHSLGARAVNAAFKRLRVTEWRTHDILAKLLERDPKDLRKTDPVLCAAVVRLVSLCKMNLVGTDFPPGDDEGEAQAVAEFWTDALDTLADHYDVELDDDRKGSVREKAFGLVPRVLELCRDPKHDNAMDFDDMIWLPVVLGLPVRKFDVLLVDEAQDLNRCQQELIKRAGKRILLCGDRNQAIYGFAGADSDSLPRMTRELGAMPAGVTVLPLTVTRRCGKAIVREANRYVPEFEAHESNGPGHVGSAPFKDGGPAKSYRAAVRDGDMIVCRVNAPLVGECFKFIRAGRKANIQGRDVGRGLAALVEKSRAGTVGALFAYLGDWLDAELEKEARKRNPSETRSQALQDRHDCLMSFAAEFGPTDPVSKVTDKIAAVFTDDKTAPGIRLSSVHRAKGLEAENVFILRTPDWGGQQKAWQQVQETNLKYVAVTRAVNTLTYIDLDPKDR